MSLNETALIEFAEQASCGLDGLEARRWRDRVDAAYADLEAACDWLIANERADEAVRLASALEKYWMMSGKLTDGREWLSRVLAVSGLTDESRARALFALGMVSFWQGDDGASRSAHEESVQVARRVGALNLEALALTGLARLTLRNGDIPEARELCQEALRVASGSSETRGRSSAIHVLSVAAQMNGDLEEARQGMWRRLELEREAGSLRLVAAECSNLSGVERQLGNFEAARDLALEALDIEARQEDVWSIPYTLNQLAAIDAACGDASRAATLLAAAEHMVEEQGAGWPPDEGPVFEETRRTCLQALGEAVFQKAWSSGAAMSWQQAAATAGRANRS